MDTAQKDSNAQASAFVAAGRAGRRSFVSDYFYWLKTNKKWWMLPLLLLLLTFGALMILASTGAAPFIYTLF
jgi:hypothetical protein